MKFLLPFLILFSLACNAQNAVIVNNAKWINDPVNPLVSIRGCVQDNDGFLWITTEMGLYRYDGLKLEKIKSEKFPDIENNRIVILEKNMCTGNILFQAYPAKNWYIIKAGVISRFNIQMRNNIVFHDGSTRRVLIDNKLKKEFENISAPSTNISDIKESPDFIVMNFFLINDYIYVRYPGTLKIINLNDAKLNKTISLKNSEMFFKTGNKIFISDKGLVYQVRGNTLLKNKPIHTDALIQSFFKQSGKKDKEHNKIITGNDATSYLLYNYNVYKIEYINKKLTARFLANAGVGDISGVYHDKKHRIYFITSSSMGILQVKESNFKSLQFTVSKYNINYSVVKLSKNNIYSGTGWYYNLQENRLAYDTLVQGRNQFFLLGYNNNFYIQTGGALLDVATFSKPLLEQEFKKNKDFM